MDRRVCEFNLAANPKMSRKAKLERDYSSFIGVHSRLVLSSYPEQGYAPNYPAPLIRYTSTMSSPFPDSANFYRNLPLLTSFAEATKSALHADVPGDWWIVVADIIGSTEAIKTGAYKKVNTVGVACIAAVTNVDRNIDLPFVFGGDGATFAIPEVLRERVVIALRGSQRLAREGRRHASAA